MTKNSEIIEQEIFKLLLACWETGDPEPIEPYLSESIILEIKRYKPFRSKKSVLDYLADHWKDLKEEEDDWELESKLDFQVRPFETCVRPCMIISISDQFVTYEKSYFLDVETGKVVRILIVENCF